MSEITDDMDWSGAVCAQADPEEWFPESGSPAALAKRLCGSCPVRAACLEKGLANGEGYGIWGGLTARELRSHPDWREPRQVHGEDLPVPVPVVVPDGFKRCSACKEPQPVTEFWEDPRRRDGLSSGCRPCTREQRRARRVRSAMRRG